jgi:hypothetical protein
MGLWFGERLCGMNDLLWIGSSVHQRRLELGGLANLSLATVLPAQVLAQAMISGELHSDYAAHIGTLLDEAPLPVIVTAVEAAAVQGGVPAAKASFYIPFSVWLKVMRGSKSFSVTMNFMQRSITRSHLHDSAGQQASDLAYWLAQPVQARIDAVEVLRAQYHSQDTQGQSYADTRLQRVCRVTQLKPS